MQARTISSLLKQIKNNEITQTDLEIEGPLDEKELKQVERALANNLVITSLNVVPPLDEKSPLAAKIATHLQRNQQILKASALIIQELLTKVPVVDDKSLKQAVDVLASKAQEALHETNSVSIIALSEALEDLKVKSHRALAEKPKSSPRLEEEILSLSSDQLTAESAFSSPYVDRQKNENQIYLDDIDRAKTLLNELGLHAIEAGRFPLHVMASYNLTTYVEKLIQLGASPHTADNDGVTPLHAAAFSGSLETAKWLVEQYSADINAASKWGTPLYLAQFAHHQNVVDYLSHMQNKGLAQYFNVVRTLFDTNKSMDPETVIAARRLFYVLGGKKLSEHAPTLGTFFHAVGGGDTEGYQTLALYLQRFMDERQLNKEDNKKLNTILKHLQQAIDTYDVYKSKVPSKEYQSILKLRRKKQEIIEDSKEMMYSQLQHAEVNERFILFTGSLRHLSGVSIQKEANGDYTLNIADRGLFYNEYESRGEKKRASIKSLNFSPEHLMEVIDLLYAAREKNEEASKQILFHDIPTVTKAKYVDNPDISQSKLKIDICYFGNPKSIVFDEFVKEFGPQMGRHLYKEFALFMRENAVMDSEKLLGSKNPHVRAGKEIVANKKTAAKINSLLAPLNNEEAKKELLKQLPDLKPYFPHIKTDMALIAFLMNKLGPQVLEKFIYNVNMVLLLAKNTMPLHKILELDNNLAREIISDANNFFLLINRTKIALNDIIKLPIEIRQEIFAHINDIIVLSDLAQVSLKELIAIKPTTLTYALNNSFKLAGLLQKEKLSIKQFDSLLPEEQVKLLKNPTSEEGRALIEKMQGGPSFTPRHK